MIEKRVFIAVCWLFSLYLAVMYGWETKAKICATVPGEQVVSTTAGVCTYAASYGRATKKRRAG